MPRGLYRRIKQSPSQGLEKFIGELELAAMEVVWQRGSVSVREVLHALNQDGRNLAYTTVMTIMGRLVEKGWLTAEKQGRAYLYRATYSRPEAEAKAVGEVVRALLQDFGDVAVAQFAKELDEMNPGQLVHLAELTHEGEQREDEPG
ncbi:MAG: BlaI/MecI/CopY family transcriptional regulator [Chloroflexota bacterium]